MPVVGPVLGILASYIYTSVTKGACTSVFAATNPVVRAQPKTYKGRYLVPMGKVAAASTLGEDIELAKHLWALSEKVVAANGIA